MRTYAINALGPLRVTEALLPALRRARNAKIVHITSGMGSISDNGSGGFYAYRMSKAALNMVTAKQAQAFADDGVTVITMHPGWLRTDMGGMSADLDPDDAARQILATIERLTHDQSGQFLRWDGTVHPW